MSHHDAMSVIWTAVNPPQSVNAPTPTLVIVAGMLMDGEIMKTYEIINYIGWCLGEKINYSKIDSIFKDYGFNLNYYKVKSIANRL